MKWIEKSLGAAAEQIKTGSTPSTSRPEYFGGGIAWFTPGDIGNARELIKSERSITELAIEEGAAKLFDAGMLLVTCIGDIGRVGVLSQPASSNQQITALKFCNDIDVNYGYYWFLKNQHQLEQRASQAVVPILNNARLREVEFSYPPLDEQKRIAAVLSKADRLRRLRRYARELSDGYLQSVFLEMFGDPVSNPRGWPTPLFGKVATIQRGRFSPRPRNDPKYYGGEYAFIQTGDIAKSNGYLRKYSQTLNENGIRVSRAFDPGTVVIAIVGATIGETAILGIRTYCPDSVVGIRIDPKKGTSEYIEHMLRFWRPVFRAMAPETARANINLETLRPLAIPLPPLPLQQKFAQIVQKYERLRAQQRESARQAEHLFQSLLHSAFRGELATHDE